MGVLDGICVAFLALIIMVPIMYPCDDIAEGNPEKNR